MEKRMLRQIQPFGLLLLFLFAGNPVQAAFPDKPITIVVHSKPGSAIDVTARRLAQIAHKYTPAVFLVENKSGGSGTVAMRYVLSKKADGTTILAATKSFISTILLTKSNLSLKDFNFFACMVIDPEALITNRHSKVRTFEDIVWDARAKKEHQRWLGPLVGGVDHLMAVKTWEVVGIRGEWIPYEGGADALAALMGHHGTVYVGNPIDVKGRPDLMIAIVANPVRLEEFPDVPTFLEKGYPALKSEVLWRGFGVKKGTDLRALHFLEDLFKKISQDPEWIEFVESTSARPVFLGHDAFARMIQNDHKEAVKYLRLAGVLPPDISQKRPWELRLFLVFLVIVLLLLGLAFRFRRHWLNGNVLFSVVLIVLSVYLFLDTFNFPSGKLSNTVGPATVPRLWIYGLIAFSVWLMIDSIRKNVRLTRENNHTGPVLAMAGLMAVYLIAIPYLGYFLSTLLFLAGGIYLMAYRCHAVVAASVAGYLFFAYLVFIRVLHVPLPKGRLFY